MAHRSIRRFALTLLATLAMAPTLVFGALLPIITCSGALPENGQQACTICDVAKVAQNVLNTGIYIAVFLSAILFAWAGWLYLTSVANPGGKDRAKTVFGNVLIGLLIILASWLVIDTVMRTLVNSNATFGLPWNQIC